MRKSVALLLWLSACLRASTGSAAPGILWQYNGDAAAREAVWSPDGLTLYTAQSGCVKAWSMPDRRLLWSEPGREPIAVVRNGTHLAITRTDLAVDLISLGTREVIHSVPGEPYDPQRSPLIPLAFSPDGTWFVQGRVFSSEPPRVVAFRDSSRIKDLESWGPGTLLTAAVSSDGAYLATAVDDSHTVVWRTADWSQAHVENMRSYAVAFSPDAAYLGMGSAFTLPPFGTPGGPLLIARQLTEPFSYLSFAVGSGSFDATRAVAWSGDGRWLACGASASELRLWDLPAGRGPIIVPRRVAATADWMRQGLSFSPDNSQLILADGGLELWTASTNPVGTRFTALSGLSDFAVSPNGAWLATSENGPTVRLWHPPSQQPARELNADAGILRAVAFSPRTNILVAAGSPRTYGGPVAFAWNVDQETSARALDLPAKPMTFARFSSDGQWLLLGGADGSVVTRLSEDLSVSETQPFQPGRCGDLSPDGSKVAFGLEISGLSGGWVSLYDRTSGTQLWRRLGNTNATETIVFSPDGKWLACAGTKPGALAPDATIRLLRVDDGETVTDLFGHRGPVRSLAFTPGGKHLVSTGEDGSIRAWSMDDLKPSGVIVSEAFVCTGLKLSPDGRTLAYMRSGDDTLIARSLENFFTPRTGLSYSRQGQAITLTWPKEQGTLWTATRLAMGEGWEPVTNGIVSGVSNSAVTLSPQNDRPSAFFQLR